MTRTLAGESLRLLEREPGFVIPEWTLYSLRPDQVEFWPGDKTADTPVSGTTAAATPGPVSSSGRDAV
jgi:hypothetical protein